MGFIEQGLELITNKGFAIIVGPIITPKEHCLCLITYFL